MEASKLLGVFDVNAFLDLSGDMPSFMIRWGSRETISDWLSRMEMYRELQKFSKWMHHDLEGGAKCVK